MSGYTGLYDQCDQYWNTSAAKIYRISHKTAEAEAHGAEVVDENGRRFLDFACSYGVFLLGHTHKQIVAAVTEQTLTLAMRPAGTRHPSAIALWNALQPWLPPSMSGLHFAHTGSECSEMTLRLISHRSPDRRRIVVAENGYHGKTLAALDIMGQSGHSALFGASPAEVVRVPYGDAESLNYAFQEPVAALFLEPVLGGPFITVPPAGYLQMARDLCDTQDSLLVFDEIQTAFGRAGEMMECTTQGVSPDLLFLSKGLTGGCAAMACVVSHERLSETIASLPEEFGNPRAGQPVACEAGVAAIRVIEEENLIQRARESGAYLRERLLTVTAPYPEIILDVPGKGLMTGVKCAHPGIELMLLMGMDKQNIHLGYSLNEAAAHPVLRFYPPLSVTREQIDRVADALASVLAEVAARPAFMRRFMNWFTKHKYGFPDWLYKLA